MSIRDDYCVTHYISFFKPYRKSYQSSFSREPNFFFVLDDAIDALL
jgi:hypothetical protein